MIGRVINNFKIISEIGHGGMGVVYRAYDAKLDRFVAIKILKMSSPDSIHFIQRFKREAKNQAQLSHPNIVPVYDLIETDGTLGIVMEFIEGETLQHVIDRKHKLDIQETLFIIKQVIKGLDYAHSKGCIHRDIKPSNIIISVDGVAKLMDFGISKAKSERGITATGMHVGTLFYMSPEQVRGEGSTVESDIYSLGVTLYEMLTGEVPFKGESDYEIFEGHLKQEPPDMLRYTPELTAGIIGIVYKALQKKPKNRFHSLKEFYADIEDFESSLLTGYSRKPIEKRSNDRKYKFKALFYSGLIILTGLFLIYFITTQVLQFWKSGKDFFALTGKDITVLDTVPADLQKKLDCKILNSGINNNLNSVFFLNDSLGFACGARGAILKTTNGGSVWIRQDTSLHNNFFSICFNTDGRGFCVGEGSAILRSEDFGASWSPVIMPDAVNYFKVKFIDNFNGFILGDRGTILKSSDKGNTWFKVNTGTTALLYDLDFPAAHEAFAVGWNGEIIKSADGGDNWYKIESFTNNYLKTIRFFSRNSGFAAGGSGDVYLTSDKGKSWQKQNLEFYDSFNDIQFVDNKIGFICGSKGKVLMTPDAGKSWIKYELKTFATLNDLALTPSGKIFAVGVNGTIIKL